MNPIQKNRQGMVLLIVLGMLGLFSLLAVTYLVYSGQSRSSGLIINRAKLSNPGKTLIDPKVILQVLRGSSDSQSAFFGHSLLGDIYGRRAIEGNVRRYINGTNSSNFSSPQYNNWNDTRMGSVLVGSGRLYPSLTSSSDLPFCKIALDVNCFIADASQRLSHIDDAYNARIFTMLEGPLAGHSFRIMKYIGEESRSLAGGSPPFPAAPIFNPPTDELSYSILINLQELPADETLEGDVSTVKSPPSPSTKFKGTISEFLSFSPNTLFYRPDGEGYKFLINDAVYNGVGYGQEPTTGNLTQQAFNPLFPTLPTPTPFTVPGYTALLPNYNYLQYLPPNYLINGSTNEGFDVADYRDFWLANVNPDADAVYSPSEIIPSYHRPELVNYIWHAYAPTRSQFNALTTTQLREMLIQIEWACARPLPLGIIDPTNSPNPSDPTAPFAVVPNTQTNLNFTAGPLAPIVVDFRSWTVNPAMRDNLYTFLSTLTGWVDSNLDGRGEPAYDVDNDGDGIADSVWVDPGLPPLTAPDGKLIKTMAAVHIIDLDSKINLNLAGDMYQAYDSPDRYLPSTGTYQPSLTPQPFNKQNVDERVGRSLVASDYSDYPYLSQGVGLGPAEIQFGHLFQNINNSHYPERYANQQSFVQSIMKARHSGSADDTDPFRFSGYPGRRNDILSGTSYGGSDLSSRETQQITSVSNSDDSVYMWSDASGNNFPTYGTSRVARGKASLALDRNGNPTLFQPTMQNANGASAFPEGDFINDPYELSQDPQPEDAPFTLEELERVLRRYDGDIDNLSKRLDSIIRQETASASNRYSLTSEINKVITTRSHELRNLPIGFPGRDQTNYSGATSNEQVGDMLKWIALLHEHHYRYVDTTQTNEATATQNDPSAIKSNTARYDLPKLSPDILRALFPIEFRYGLRMNLNRPFGNGLDNNNNGVVDEPVELAPNTTYPLAYFSEQGTAWTSTNLPLVHGTYDQLGYDESGAGRFRYYPDDGSGTTQKDLTNPISTRTNPGDLSSRQLYARQLYCLAQLLIPPDYQLPLMNDLTTPQNRDWYKRRAKILAQWAVNVVDFRDSDAVMTRFSYDYLPFGIGAHHGMTAKLPGWNPEAGDVVWGMEYPELLITETLALHDKRVRQRNQNNPPADPTARDIGVQFRIPQGSLFVELYNPRTSPQNATSADSREQPAVPKELYYYDSNSNSVKLQLSKLAPQSTLEPRYGTQPVWRIGITPPTGTVNAPAFTQDQILNSTTPPGGPVGSTALPTNQLSETGSATNSESPGVSVAYVEMNGLTNDISLIAAPPGGGGRMPAGTPIQFERMIWFTSQAPDGTSNYGGLTRIPNLIDGGNPTSLKHRVFYNKSLTTNNNADVHLAALLPLGGYTILAPRDNTFIGQRITTRAVTDPWNEPSPQRITYRRATGAFEVTRLDGSLTSTKFAAALRNPTVFIQQADPPSETAPEAWLGNTDEPLVNNLFHNQIGGDEGIGLNVSEPLPILNEYYKLPSARVNSTTDTAAPNPATAFPGGFASTGMRRDGYADFGAGAQRGDEDIADDQNPPKINPILATINQQHRTHNDFRQLHLQRLADPTQAYDPVWNPYITVDVMPVDLSLYTGESNPQDYAQGGITIGKYAFESRFKDGRSMHEYVAPVTPPVDNSNPADIATLVSPKISNFPSGGNWTTRSYFSASTAKLYETVANTTYTSTIYFPRELGFHRPNTGTYSVSSMTLGYLNVGHQVQPDATAFDPTTYAARGLNFDGFGPPQRDQSVGSLYPNLAGSPDPNFFNVTGLYWPNRPFANAAEIMQVPFTPPGMFGAQFTHGIGHNNGTGPIVNAFSDSVPLQFKSTFGHLLNFFAFKLGFNDPTGGAPVFAAGTATELTIPRREPYWMRPRGGSPSLRSSLGYLLELIETPPLYKETARILDPRATDITATDTAPGQSSQTYSGPIPDGTGAVDTIRRRMLADYRYPHNKQATYTNPGKININTITDEREFRALESLADTDPSVHLAATSTGQATVFPRTSYSPIFWQNFRQHMRGYQNYGATPNPNTPESLPLYSGASININPNMDSRLPSQFVGAFQSPFNAGITPPLSNPANLSGFRTNLPANTTLRRPLDLANPVSVATPTPYALLSPLSVSPPGRMPDREFTSMPFNLYQRFGRLTNLVTNQSNVFAVWITVGLFEWDPVNGLGKEYVGTDGKTDRQRSFYIIDRTVPVAYREGNNFNTEKAILLRRNISRKF